MKKMNGILAVGIILLFIGLAFSPITAQAKGSFLDTLQHKLQLSERDLATMERFLPALMEKMQTATSYTELVGAVHDFMKEYGQHPFLVMLLNLIIKVIDFNYNANQLRPVRKTSFIMSWGFLDNLLSLGKDKVTLYRPFTTWFYSGRSNAVLNSRTIIIDPYPFSIRALSGRQLGILSNFVGVYIHMTGAVTGKTRTFFVGYAGTIRGFDLSPFNK